MEQTKQEEVVMTRTQLQTQFFKETGTEVVNSQGEFDIDYVQWLENKLLKPTLLEGQMPSEEEIMEQINILSIDGDMFKVQRTARETLLMKQIAGWVIDNYLKSRLAKQDKE